VADARRAIVAAPESAWTSRRLRRKRRQQDGNLVTENAMLDVLMVVLTIVFFGVAVAYVVACERLQ
jgi:hypothetical protein